MRSRLPVRSAALAAAAATVLTVVPAAPALAGPSHHRRARTHRAPVSRAVSAPTTSATTPATTRTTPATGSTTSTASTTTTTGRPATTPSATPTTSTPSTTPTTSTPTTGGTGARLHRGGRAGGLALTVTRHGKLVGGIAHIASLIGDSIIDFAFSPATITIHVGDTVTWTNTGKQLHSATANNHSFDTGLLKTGQSASHTFTTAGTYSYICIVHPFMHGTVVVLANATTTTPTTHTSTTPTGTSATTPTSTTTPTATTASGPTLPVTGADLGTLLGFGVTLTGLGLAVRRRVRS
jgi:plastocyanin